MMMARGDKSEMTERERLGYLASDGEKLVPASLPPLLSKAIVVVKMTMQVGEMVMIPGERGGKARPCESTWQEPGGRSGQLPRSQRPEQQHFL